MFLVFESPQLASSAIILSLNQYLVTVPARQEYSHINTGFFDPPPPIGFFWPLSQ